MITELERGAIENIGVIYDEDRCRLIGAEARRFWELELQSGPGRNGGYNFPPSRVQSADGFSIVLPNELMDELDRMDDTGREVCRQLSGVDIMDYPNVVLRIGDSSRPQFWHVDIEPDKPFIIPSMDYRLITNFGNEPTHIEAGKQWDIEEILKDGSGMCRRPDKTRIVHFAPGETVAICNVVADLNMLRPHMPAQATGRMVLRQMYSPEVVSADAVAVFDIDDDDL